MKFPLLRSRIQIILTYLEGTLIMVGDWNMVMDSEDSRGPRDPYVLTAKERAVVRLLKIWGLLDIYSRPTDLSKHMYTYYSNKWGIWSRIDKTFTTKEEKPSFTELNMGLMIFSDHIPILVECFRAVENCSSKHWKFPAYYIAHPGVQDILDRAMGAMERSLHSSGINVNWQWEWACGSG